MSPALSPTQDASKVPTPALLVSKPRHKGEPDSNFDEGVSTNFIVSAAFNMFILNGLPFTCLPLHLILTS